MANYVQSSVQNTAAFGAPGLPGDGWFGTDITSVPAGDGYGASAGIQPGYALYEGTTGVVDYPTSSGQVTAAAGIGVADPALESLDILFPQGKAVPVMRKGRIWVVFEDPESAVVNSSPYVRTSGVGTPGAFKSTSTNATQATWAVIKTVDTLYGVVELDINLP